MEIGAGETAIGTMAETWIPVGFLGRDSAQFAVT